MLIAWLVVGPFNEEFIVVFLHKHEIAAFIPGKGGSVFFILIHFALAFHFSIKIPRLHLALDLIVIPMNAELGLRCFPLLGGVIFPFLAMSLFIAEDVGG